MRQVFLLIMLSFLSSCASQYGSSYSVAVNSFASPNLKDTDNIAKKKYLLLPSNSKVSEQDFEFIEFAEYVKRGLAQKGYEYTDNRKQADLIIFFEWNISDPKVTQGSYQRPITTYEPGKTYNYNSNTVYGNNYLNPVQTNGSVSTQGQYKTTYQTVSYTNVTYARTFLLIAYDKKEILKKNAKSPSPLWKTQVASVGSSGDLRSVMPALIASSFQYFGTNSGKIVRTEISETDNRVSLIKGEIENRVPAGTQEQNVVPKKNCAPILKLLRAQDCE